MAQFSYFEFINSSGKYVSLFPSNKTTFSGSLPNLETPVFEDLEIDMFNLLNAMEKINLGFLDYFWFIPSSKDNTYTEKYILTAMKSLYYEPVSTTAHYGLVKIRSYLHPEFVKTAYIKDNSLPQEAVDVIPVFTDDSMGDRFVVLGYKKKSDNVTVTFEDKEPITMLSVGIYGHVIFGEHLETSEKAKMEMIHATANGNYPFSINDKEISPVLRTLLEEGGFALSANQCKCKYVGMDNVKGRDIRYGTFGEGGMFGYERTSFSYTVRVDISGKPPMSVPEPVDTKECSKGVIITYEEAMREFKEGGKYPPAFPSHCRQLRMCDV